MPVTDCFVSVVVPLQDDEDIVDGFVEELCGILRSHYENHEVLLVDDASQDRTGERVQALLTREPGLRALRLSRRFGQEVAISAGLDTAIGDFVVVILPDSDPPALIPEMVERARNGAAIVFGIRADRRRDPAFIRLGYRLFCWLCNRVLDLHVPPNATHFRVLSRQAVNAITRIRSRGRYLRVLSDYIGFTREGFTYTRQHRRARPRRKTLIEALRLGADTIVSNTTSPLRILSWLALMASLIAIGYGAYVVIVYVMSPDVVEGWATLAGPVALMFSLLFVILAIFAEYLGRMLDEVKDRPLYYTVDERLSEPPMPLDERRNVVTKAVPDR